jgi:hypothetical protein
MIGTMHLTRLYPAELEKRIRTTVPGMAHWSEPGSNKRCEQCAHWHDERRYKIARCCQKYSELMQGRRGPRVPGETVACKYFTSAEGDGHHG